MAVGDNVTYPIHASYGDKDHGHALLKSDCNPDELPIELLGLTDRPSGNIIPGEQWWPSIGCGPVGKWWAIWWTSPDEHSSRGGMVHSEVALWPLDEIGKVKDLDPIISEISGKSNIHKPSSELLTALIETLMSRNTKPPVIQDIESLPGIISTIWTRLWPEARRSFSTRVALSPPQNGDSINPPWFFCILSDRAPQWIEHELVSNKQHPTNPSRATCWLLNGSDPLFDEVLKACNKFPINLSEFTHFSRAADRLEQLRKSPQPEQTIGFLRTIILLAKEAKSAVSLKLEALQVLKTHFKDCNPSFILSLSNIDPINLPAKELPEYELATWISIQMPELHLNDISKIFERLSPNEAKQWWQQTISSTVSNQMTKPNMHWAIAALKWMGLPNNFNILDISLHTTEENERCLLNAAEKLELPTDTLNKICKESEKRKWSRLHAWSLMKSLPEPKAIIRQKDFSGDPYPGLEFLVAQLSGAAIIQAAISISDLKLLELVAYRTVNEPELLTDMDASIPEWRILWAKHIANGGQHWPPRANKDVLGSTLLNSILCNEAPKGLIGALAEDIAEITISHTNRKQLWPNLKDSDRTKLLSQVSTLYIKKYDDEQLVPTPEQELAEIIVDKARLIQPSTRLLTALITWNVNLNEHEVIQWISGIKPLDWKYVAINIGTAILNKKWERVAKKLYILSKSTPEILPAVNICKDLLSLWDRSMYSFYSFAECPPVPDDISLAHRLADLGATLSPDQLSYIWERSGGERKHLNTTGTPETLWHEAAILAQQGKLDGGLRPLLRELLKHAPNNLDLQELDLIVQQTSSSS